MSYETIFSIINISVMPAWTLLILLPRAGITRTLVHSGLYPIGLGIFYAVTLVMSLFLGYGAEGGEFTSAAGVSQLFSHPHGVLVGWSHYLVFDLFVGAWIGRDAQRKGISHFIAAPCQLFAFLLGPVGLLAYMLIRLAMGKGWALTETDA